MSLRRKLKVRKERRAKRSRARIKGSLAYRVSVFRSLNNIYAQLINDDTQQTITSFSSLQLKDNAGDKKEVAKKVGIKLAQEAVNKGVKQAVFDRGSYLYHGRVKSLAEGLREGGLQF